LRRVPPRQVAEKSCSSDRCTCQRPQDDGRKDADEGGDARFNRGCQLDAAVVSRESEPSQDKHCGGLVDSVPTEHQADRKPCRTERQSHNPSNEKPVAID
jgi:hypothetical protein